MSRRKSSGNPFTKGLGRLLEDVGGKALDTGIEIAAGPGKPKGHPKSASPSSTDWATRAPAPERKRRSR